MAKLIYAARTRLVLITWSVILVELANHVGMLIMRAAAEERVRIMPLNANMGLVNLVGLRLVILVVIMPNALLVWRVIPLVFAIIVGINMKFAARGVNAMKEYVCRITPAHGRFVMPRDPVRIVDGVVNHAAMGESAGLVHFVVRTISV